MIYVYGFLFILQIYIYIHPSLPRTHTHTHTYIYIYCQPQTDCFVLSELFSAARYVGRAKPGSKTIQLYVRLGLRPLGQQAYHVWLREFLRYYIVTTAAVCLHFYTLSATRVLNSFEELCIMRAAAENAFTRVLNPHRGAYISSITDRLFRFIRKALSKVKFQYNEDGLHIFKIYRKTFLCTDPF